jgi:hypothetical protein
MKSNRTLRGFNLLFAGLAAACLFAGSASAQKAYEGNFTLPFGAKWGGATLPAGNYSFTVDSASVGSFVKVTGQDGKQTQASIRIMGVSDQQSIEQPSQLIVVPSRGAYRICVFQEPRLGMVLIFAAPKAERQLLAQAAPGELIRRITISASAR